MNPNVSQENANPIPTKGNKVKVIPLVLGIILLLGSTGYFLYKAIKTSKISTTSTASPAPLIASTSAEPLADNPQNLQTYVDPTYHFSIQYPKEILYTSPSYAPDNAYYTITFKPDPKTAPSGTPQTQGLEIRVLNNTKKLSSRDYIEQVYIGQTPTLSESDTKKQIESAIKLNVVKSLDATWIDNFTSGLDSTGPQVFIGKDNNMYQLISADHGPSGAFRLQFILNSFKFTQ